MAAYIPVPRDLTRVKTKVFFNLTKRQLLCFGAAALIGVPIFFLVKATGNVSLAALSMMIVMLPLFFLAMYEKGYSAVGSGCRTLHSDQIRSSQGSPLSDGQLL